MRDGGGPCFLELRTYRFRAHSMYDPDLYRSKEEIERWRQRDPIALLAAGCASAALLDDAELERIEQEVAAEIDDAVAFAEAGDARAGRGPRALRVRRAGGAVMTATATTTTTYREALRAAIADAMRRDERVFLMGEDVGRYGGSFGVSRGLLDEFGPERIRDTPLSESGFVGAGIGAALGGMRPIVEVMTVNFACSRSTRSSTTPRRSRTCPAASSAIPLVIRMTTGAGRQLAAQHSHSLEGWYAHVPGLQGARARHARGRPRHAVAGAAGPQPGRHLRARLAVQRRGRARGRSAAGRHRARRDPPLRQRRDA